MKGKKINFKLKKVQLSHFRCIQMATSDKHWIEFPELRSRARQPIETRKSVIIHRKKIKHMFYKLCYS